MTKSKWWTVYRTVNQINGEFYFGVHKTDNPNDGYLGSGKLLKQAVEEYGRENFRKDVLEIYDSRRAAYLKEEEIVEPQIGLPGCLNLCKGGRGGFDYLNRTGLNVIGSKKAIELVNQKINEDNEFSLYMSRIRSEAGSKAARLVGMGPIQEANKRKHPWKGKHHQELSKQKIANALRIAAKGVRNSNFGLRWVNKDGQVEHVKETELEDWLQRGWKRGKKQKVRKIRIPKFKISWPEDTVLLAMLVEASQEMVARKLGVTDMAVHAHLKRRGLKLPVVRKF